MDVLILNQAFYPDVVAVAQYAADLANALAQRGHNVTVVASMRAYDSPSQTFKPEEMWQGVRISRVPSTALGKKALWRRAIDFASFYVSCIVRLATLPRYDVVIAMTVPPLISVIAALYVRAKGGSLVSWVMDLNPDEAIAAGAIKDRSLLANTLSWLLRFSLFSSGAIVVLDRFMRGRIIDKGIPAARVFVIPPWTHDSVVRYDSQAREQFRSTHGLDRKFVVMYSGNHSPVHPLDTLLEAARYLAMEPGIHFLFVGGGSQFPKVQEFASRNALGNILCLPYQPLTSLAGSLSSADLHVVLMGERFVGTVHPCKIYNILAIGSPFLYIGPAPNHVTDVVEGSATASAYFANHGDIEAVISHIRQAAARGPLRDAAHMDTAEQFSEAILIPRLISVIEECVPNSERRNERGMLKDIAESHWDS